MLLALELSLKEKIEKQYEEWMACCPNKKSEIDAWIKSADEDEAVCMKYLYAYMHPCDIVSYDVEVIASYVKATLDMYANVPYAKKVPAELFFTYVLCVRVNNEDLDKSREWIYRQLVDRVKDKKTMVEAALEVKRQPIFRLMIVLWRHLVCAIPLVDAVVRNQHLLYLL